MTWRHALEAVGVVAIIGLAYELGVVTGDRARLAMTESSCRAALVQEAATAEAARLHAEEMNRQREEMVRRLGDQAAVVNDLGQQLDRLRSGCPGKEKP